MPELPEVEVISRGLNKTLAGRKITRVEVPWPTSLRQDTDEFIHRVLGAEVIRARRRAKLLIVDLDNDIILAFHLKMTGQVIHSARPAPAKHLRVFMELDDSTFLNFSDMRRFGLCLALKPSELLKWSFYRDLGPEPLEMDREEFLGLFRNRKARIKSLLLDQKVIAGVGNIYADESLFRAGIHPAARSENISDDSLSLLFDSLRNVLRQAISENGSSISDYRDSGGNAGAFQNSFRAYGRCGECCVNCGRSMEKVTVAGRTSTFCPDCQPLDSP